MGVSRSCCAKSPNSDGRRVAKTGDSGSLVNSGIFRIKAEVYSLSRDDESLKWVPLFSECVQISMECLQEGDVYVYSLHSSVSAKKQFSTKIYIPGTNLRQTSDCFIQWRDWNDDAGAWGINFMSENDAANFLKACSPPSLTPHSAKMRHAFSTLSLSVPIPLKAGTSQLEHGSPSSVKKFVIDTVSEGTSSHNEKHEVLAQETGLISATVTEAPDGLAHNQTELFLLPDESATSFKRKSILFSEQYNQSGSFEGPSLPSSPPPESLNSPVMITSSGVSTPWVFPLNDSAASNLSIDPPHLPLSSPPGKTISPRTSTSFINAYPVNLVPDSNLHLSTLLEQLPLAEVVTPEVDKPVERTVNESKVTESQGNAVTQSQNEKCFADNASHEVESTANQDDLSTKKENQMPPEVARSQMASGQSPRLNDYKDSGLETECDHPSRDDDKQFTNHNKLLKDFASDKHTNPLTEISGYNSDSVVQRLRDFLPKMHESSSYAPTEISNTSDETPHVAVNIHNSISTNSLNTLTTESEEDTISRSTAVANNVTDPTPGSNESSVDSKTVEYKQVTKAGFLEMKRILIHRNQVVAMASRKQWKKYWVKLKGSTLIFYICENVSTVSDEAPVSLRIDIEGCIAHPEHMKRDNVICLSTSLGDTYYLQTTSQAEVDSWIRAIHSVAVISLTKHLVKEESITILKKRQAQIEEMIESENKLMKLAELQLSVSNSTTKEMIIRKIEKWSKYIERLHLELYRHRCYLASLQGSELPNPQSLLANVMKSTKSALVKLGTFSVASVHAKVCARHGGMLLSLHKKTSSFKASTDSPVISPTKNIKKNLHPKKKTSTLPRSKKEIFHPLLREKNEIFRDEDQSKVQEGCLVKTGLAIKYVKVKMPDGHGENTFEINEASTINDILLMSCEEAGLDSEDYFIQLRHETDHGELATAVPSNEDLLIKWEYSNIEVIHKLVYTLKLVQTANEKYTDFGMIITPKYSDKTISKLFIEKVLDDGPADVHGITEGDEILMINEKQVIGMKSSTLHQQFKDDSVLLTIKSNTTEVPCSFKETTDTIINDLVLPAPPSQHEITEDSVKQLIIPDPESMESAFALEKKTCNSEIHLEEVDKLLKDSDDLNKLLHSMKEYSEDELDDLSSRRSLSKTEKLCKCLLELLDTEKEYVKDLDKLVSRYLIPLKAETFITPTELTVLFGNILNITQFQHKFLEHLELIMEDISITDHHEHMEEERLRRMLFSVAGTFIYFLDHFKLYSTFCASHCQAQEVLRQTENDALQEFLAARNPKNEHLLTLESLLIKPIQRVLRYPLFLKAMKDLTPKKSDEQKHLIEAINGMDRVADYINEMQRIHDLYFPLFNKLMSHSQDEKKILNLTIDQLLYNCVVIWLNPSEEFGKGWRKGGGPEVLCFVFVSAIIITLERKRTTRKHFKALNVDLEEVKFSAAIPLDEYSIFNLPDSDGVTGMWQLVQIQKDHSATKPNRYLFRSLDSEKNEILQIMKEKSSISDIIEL